MPPTPKPPPPHRRATVFAGALCRFPEPLGDARLRLDHEAMAWVEDTLEPELDRLNDRVLEGRGPLDDHTGEPVEWPYESVWDAMGVLSRRKLAKISAVLVTAGLAHRYDGEIDQNIAQARDDVRSLPDGWWTDEEIAEALSRALATAFGQDPAEEDLLEDPPPAPPVEDGGASASAGTTSSPSGPLPSRSAG